MKYTMIDIGIFLIPKTHNANMVKDYRPITLIGSLYKIISKILANRLTPVLGDMVNEVQSAFVANRQILDGPFILNELFHWCKMKKKQTMIFKVDFEKAYDSVWWDYLDEVLKKFGFGERWCGWIQSCLRSSRGSILVNGSPTNEFQFHKGLKQGDPLSPFLFILVMESFHILVQRVVDVGMFKGISLGPSLHLSHLFYADDVVFMGQWTSSNIDIIIQVLECFYRASGLRINMNKSMLMGISVANGIVDQIASEIGCKMLKAPFSYLGSKVGAPLKVLQKMESIRSQFFNGSDLDDRKPIWVKWNNVLASKEKGGLGVIRGILSDDGKLHKKFNHYHPSIWLDNFHEVRLLKDQGVDLCSFIHKKMGNGSDTSFWEDTWKGVLDFKTTFPRIYSLESDKNITIADKIFDSSLEESFRQSPRSGIEQEQYLKLIASVEDVVLINMQDRWVSSKEGSGEFSVASARRLIDDQRMPYVSTKTRWVTTVSIKVNVHAWKVKIDRLPTRINISRYRTKASFSWVDWLKHPNLVSL
ncbi:RNA-directed DNA polymerase, eukaryota, reverse transcriptase zinc-binding domain protein [Tanacetum coccineum]